MLNDISKLEKLLNLSVMGVPSYSVVLVNGRLVPEISNFDDSDGLRVFVGENGCGVYVRISNSVKYEKPIHIINYIDFMDENFGDDGDVKLSGRSNIVVDDGVDVVLLESIVSGADCIFEFCGECDISIGKNANVRRYVVCDVANDSKTKFLCDVDVADGAKFLEVSAGLNIGNTKVQKNFNIGAMACVGAYTSIYAKDKSNVDFQVKLCHNGDDGRSMVGLWAVDDGRVEFETQANVCRNVRGVETSQESRILLNSDNAIGRVKPFQFIATEGAKAYHGAVVSGVREEELFFLCSRGMDVVEAKKTIAESVMANILNFIVDDKVRDCMNVVLKK